MDMEIKIGVVESHYYKGVRELQKIDLEKFPLIKQFLEVNPDATEQDLLRYMKKIKDKEFQSFLNELTWNEIKEEDSLSESSGEYHIVEKQDVHQDEEDGRAAGRHQGPHGAGRHHRGANQALPLRLCHARGAGQMAVKARYKHHVPAARFLG
jgi:hypothetical protein